MESAWEIDDIDTNLSSGNYDFPLREGFFNRGGNMKHSHIDSVILINHTISDDRSSETRTNGLSF